MKKIKLLSAFIIFAVLAGVFSCKIEEEPFSNEPFVNEARNWLSQQIVSSKNAREKKQRFNLNTIDWDKAVSVKYQGYKEAIEIPLENKNIKSYRLKQTEFTVSQTQTKILILKDNKGNISSEIIDIFVYDKNAKKGSKVFDVESLNGVLIKSNISQKIVDIGFLKNGKNVKKSGKVMEQCYEMWLVMCDYNPDTGQTSNCVQEELLDSWCEPDGGGGGDGGGDNGSNNRITNELSYPCFNSTFSSMVNGSFDNKVQNILQNFNKSANQNFTIRDEWNDNELINATTQGNIITLNMKALANASQEFIAKVIYHEILHVYLNNSTAMSDHQIMGNDYVNPMADALQSWFPINRDDAIALAWSGLQSSGCYQVLSQSEKTNIEDVVVKRYKNYGNQFNNQYGKHCD